MKIITNIKHLLIIPLVLLLIGNQNIAQNVGIGAESFTPHESAMLEVKSTELNPKGFLPPRMTTAVRDLIQNPATGLVIFNTTSNCLEIMIGSYWQRIYCGCATPPTAPTTGTHITSETQIIWNWNAVIGADGYKYNTENNYTSASDNGTSTTFTQENLDCETAYTLYVWAYNICGNSTVLTLTQTTSACPICDVPSVTFTYKGQQVTYGTVESSGKCWLDRNLGATQVATGSTDANAYGDLFQWGRAADGHQIRNSSTTSSLSNTNTPSHSSFIMANNSPNDWRSPQNNLLWQGVSGANNPCPSGWRIPNQADWDAEILSWGSNLNTTGAFNSPLKLTLGGFRGFSDGSLYYVGDFGNYWASSVDGVGAKNLFFYSGGANVVDGWGKQRATGRSVRCIKD